MSAELYELIDELRATANRGLAWSGNDHDRQRYENVLAAAARLDDAPIVVRLDGEEAAGWRS